MSNPHKGKWYRFNDTTVEEFEMTEESLESECFGGKYKAKVYDNCMYFICSFNIFSIRSLFNYDVDFFCLLHFNIYPKMS